MNSDKKDKIIHYFIIAIVFCGLLAYFCVAHPLILADTDDWYNASHWRRPLPVWGEFNGIKVFPETLMAFCSLIASTFVMPFKHNYLLSLALVYGTVAALLTTIYTWGIQRLIKISVDVSAATADLLAVCFLMLHFLIYKNDFSGNVHLLWATDVTCLFNYTFSAVLNACLVMFFIKRESLEGHDVSQSIWRGDYGYLKAGMILLLVYLAVFSNMFNNVILVAYSGIHALIALFQRHDANISLGERLKLWFQRKWLFMTIVLMWFVAIIFQMNDPRNSNARFQGAKGSLSGAIKAYANNFNDVNKMAVLIVAIMITSFVLTCFMRKDSNKKSTKLIIGITQEIVLGFLVTSVYLIILCGVASPEYLLRNDVKIGLFFYILMEVMLLFGWVIGNSKKAILQMILPIVLFILVFQTLNYCKPYRDFNMSGLPYEKVYEISADLVNQFKEADEMGLDEFELHVVCNASAVDNWPYPAYAGDLISDTLYRHGVISKPIKAITVFDSEKNKELKVCG